MDFVWTKQNMEIFFMTFWESNQTMEDKWFSYFPIEYA